MRWLLVAIAAATMAVAQGPTFVDDHEEIIFRCPPPPFGTLPVGVSPTSAALSTDVVTYGAPPDYCPYKIYDDTHPFGNPQIVVNDDDPREVVFCALHDPGVSDPEAQTHMYSRRGQTHVAFTTADQGHTWQDQPIQPFQVPGGDFGDMPDCTMDSAGHVYLSYLWSTPRGVGPDRDYNFTIGLYKGATAVEEGGVMRSYDSSETAIRARGPRNAADFAHILRVDEAFVPDPYSNATGNTTGRNETGSDTGRGSVGEFAVNGTIVDETMVVSWLERGPEIPCWEGKCIPSWTDDEGEERSGWIDFAWTDTAPASQWIRLATEELIGPCREASNPVQYQSQVYVACQVGKGYEHRARARIGDIDIWRLDPTTGETELVAPTGVIGGRPMLTAAPDGYMVLTSHWVPSPDPPTAAPMPEVNLAVGWYGRSWTAVGDLGPALHQLAGNRPFLDVDVTALSVGSDQKTGVLFYKEFHQPTDPDRADAIIASGAALQDLTKIIISFNNCDGIVAARQVVTGAGLNPYQVQAYQDNPGIYNDQQDGLWWTIDPLTGEELWYFGINDYGAMQYGAIVTAAASDNFCPQIPPLLNLPPAAAPHALTLTTPGMQAIAASVGAAAVAGVGYLLLARRKSAHAATTKAK